MGTYLTYILLAAIVLSIIGFFVLVKIIIFSLVLGNKKVVTSVNYVQEYLGQDNKINSHIPVPFHVWTEARDYQINLLEQVKDNVIQLQLSKEREAQMIELDEKNIEQAKQKKEED